ncbi:MAG: thermonuclease family protein [Candidatus Humimicrobiia bacterium]
MIFLKKISPKVVAFLIIVYLLFTFTGCPSPPPTETLEVTEETIEEVTKERNHPPKAIAGENLEIEVGGSAFLNGEGSSDPDGDILTYTWDFGNGRKAYKKYVYVKYDEIGIYTITLTVSDGEYEDSDTLTINVTSAKQKVSEETIEKETTEETEEVTTIEETEQTTEEEVTEERKETAYVTRVIDGDTIEVDINGKVYKVRYIGINTPEYNQPFGDKATQANSSLVSGKTVILEKDVSETDKYGRLLRYVFVGDLFVNAHLVKFGWAQAATYPPDVKYSALFVSLERESRENNEGCWAITEETEEEPPPPTEEERPSSGVFLGSKKSDVYHYQNCRYVKQILPENIIRFTSVEDARNHGYRPCKVCKPP